MILILKTSFGKQKTKTIIKHNLSRSPVFTKHIVEDVIGLEDTPPPALEALYLDSINFHNEWNLDFGLKKEKEKKKKKKDSSIQTYSCELGWFLHMWWVKLKKKTLKLTHAHL